MDFTVIANWQAMAIIFFFKERCHSSSFSSKDNSASK